ncbi:MAG: hypothetical protein ACYDFR_06095, partial [Candidatus Omnitrophota bacterium]
MSRVKMANGLQTKFLNSVSKAMNSDWEEVSKIANVSSRTLFDWRREKYKMSYETLIKLNRISKVEIPKVTAILSDYWNVRKAGLAGGIERNRLYGNLGTVEGRIKGGKISQYRFSKNPEYARKVGFNIRNTILSPKNSEFLAEFLGIALGDGGITNHQITISLNSKTEVVYADFIKKLIFDLFGIHSTIKTGRDNSIRVIATGRNLVDFLLSRGLKIGNKIKQQIGVPRWILRNKLFMKSCLKGLIDTDGGIYFHKHVTKGIKYRHMGLCFTSYSR